MKENSIKNFKFKKKYGQNFIMDNNIINSIISKSGVDKETLVIEIGPGAGSLTVSLCEKAGFVLAYEIDKTLEPILNENLSLYNNYKIIYKDFLKEKITNEIKKHSLKKLYVVANLPYYITTPIVIKLIQDKIDVDKIVIMVQKEVGYRFSAKPNTKEYNSLTIFLNYYYNVKKIMDVNRKVFVPVPNVDSIVLSFDKKDNKEEVDEEIFFKLVRDSFRQKRKTIRNNLKEYDLIKIEEILKKHGFDLSVRAEALSRDIFIDIANNLSNN